MCGVCVCVCVLMWMKGATFGALQRWHLQCAACVAYPCGPRTCAGYVHQTVTVGALRPGAALLDPAPPSEECSYFKGYAWTCAYCGGCTAHIGWMFTRVAPSARAHVGDADGRDMFWVRACLASCLRGSPQPTTRAWRHVLWAQ